MEERGEDEAMEKMGQEEQGEREVREERKKGKVEGEESVRLLKRKTNVWRKERGVAELFPLACS